MWDWISENSGLVQAGMAAVTALVWMVYLHIIVSGLRRPRRTEILIQLGGARNLSARILVSNLGFEPIYVLEIMLTVWTASGERMSSVADRTRHAAFSRLTPKACAAANEATHSDSSGKGAMALARLPDSAACSAMRSGREATSKPHSPAA